MNTPDLIQNLSGDLKPVKPLKSNTRRFTELVLICASFVVMGIFYWNIRTGETVHPQGRTIVEMFLLAVSALACSYWATRSVSPHHSKPRVVKWSPLALVGWSLVLLVAFFMLYFDDPNAALEALQYKTWLCPIVMASIALPVAILSFAYLSRGAIHFPLTTFFYWATLSITFGALGLAFVCPWADPLHELLWHVLPAFLALPPIIFLATALFRFWSGSAIKNIS